MLNFPNNYKGTAILKQKGLNCTTIHIQILHCKDRHHNLHAIYLGPYDFRDAKIQSLKWNLLNNMECHGILDGYIKIGQYT